MSTRGALRRWSLLVVAPALLVAACSTTSDVDTEGTAAPGTSSDLAEASTDGTTAGSAPGSTSTTRQSTTTTSQRTTTTTGSPSTTGVATPGNEAFCARLIELSEQFESIEDDPGDLATMEQRLLAMAKQFFGELNALAPPPIAADWALLNDAVQKITTIAEMEVVGDDPAFEGATDRIEVWVLANCGYDLGSG